MPETMWSLEEDMTMMTMLEKGSGGYEAVGKTLNRTPRSCRKRMAYLRRLAREHDLPLIALVPRAAQRDPFTAFTIDGDFYKQLLPKRPQYAVVDHVKELKRSRHAPQVKPRQKPKTNRKDDGIYVVEYIVKSRRRSRKGPVEYLIKWEGYSEKTWITRDLFCSDDLVAEFEAQQK